MYVRGLDDMMGGIENCIPITTELRVLFACNYIICRLCGTSANKSDV